MNFQILLFIYLGLIVNVFGKMEKIIGGEMTHILKYPFMASIRYISSNAHICGGSIISHWHILSAAHCFYGAEDIYYDMAIYTGTSSSYSLDGTMSTIRRVHIHNDYSSPISMLDVDRHDIAVVTLNQPLIFSPFQNKIKLPARTVMHGDDAIVIGWGVKDYESMEFSETIRSITMKIVPNNICQPILFTVMHSEHICVYEKPEYGACMGDTGGPLVVSGRLAGISSFVFPCGKGYPDVYTNVHNYIKFIEALIE